MTMSFELNVISGIWIERKVLMRNYGLWECKYLYECLNHVPISFGPDLTEFLIIPWMMNECD